MFDSTHTTCYDCYIVGKYNYQTLKYTGENTMPLVKVKNKFQITIPPKVRDEVHIKEGDFLEIEAQGETIIIKPKSIVDRNSVAASIDEGMEDYKKGRTTQSFSSVEEFKATFKK